MTIPRVEDGAAQRGPVTRRRGGAGCW